MQKSILKYKVDLSKDQRSFLEQLTRKGKVSARKIKRANILLLADEGKKDREITEIVRVSDGTIERTRKRFVLEGLVSSLEEKPRPGKPKKIGGRQEAEIIKLACSNPPEGRAKWTLRLLADKIELVMDNLNTHKLSILYEFYSPEAARRLVERFEVHYTPVHGSWLNIAEIELSVTSRQCTKRRIPDIEFLQNELKSWTNERNEDKFPVNWRFTT